MTSKRIFDLSVAIVGLVCLSPFFLLIAVWIKSHSVGPIFFRQQRVGQFGRLFWIYKFRTMYNSTKSTERQLTLANDLRVTGPGHFLRHYKLDELPQLINVVMGNMSLVGPRPEVPIYVNHYPPEVKTVVLSVPPGITDYASVLFKDEAHLLAMSDDHERTYIEEILPIKLQYYQEYVAKWSASLDFRILLKTFLHIFICRERQKTI